MNGYIIEWFEGCWLTDGIGDPARTLVVENAKVFSTIYAAEKHLERDKRRNPHRDFNDAKVLDNPTENSVSPIEDELCFWCSADIDTVVHSDGENYCSTECSKWEPV